MLLMILWLPKIIRYCWCNSFMFIDYVSLALFDHLNGDVLCHFILTELYLPLLLYQYINEGVLVCSNSYL